MFNILYKTSVYLYRTREERKILAGMVATFSGDREVRISDPSSIPIGIFAADFDPIEISYSPLSISVCMFYGEYATNVYEISEYHVGDLLYCSPKGKITNSKEFMGTPTVGIVSAIEEKEIIFITCFTNLESVSRFRK